MTYPLTFPSYYRDGVFITRSSDDRHELSLLHEIIVVLAVQYKRDNIEKYGVSSVSVRHISFYADLLIEYARTNEQWLEIKKNFRSTQADRTRRCRNYKRRVNNIIKRIDEFVRIRQQQEKKLKPFSVCSEHNRPYCPQCYNPPPMIKPIIKTMERIEKPKPYYDKFNKPEWQRK